MKIRTQFQPRHLQSFVNIDNILTGINVSPKDVKIIENHKAAYGLRAYQILDVSNNDYLKIKQYFEDQDLYNWIEILG